MAATVLRYLEESAATYPQKPAVIDEHQQCTYQELRTTSRRIASALAPKVERGTPVMVYMEKGVDALTVFFGTLYAGSFYSLLNPELPKSRLEQIQSVLQAQIVVTSADLKDAAADIFPTAELLTVEELRETEEDPAALAAAQDAAIDTDPVYINFTSGSTGTPKGIVVCHRSIVDFIDCFTQLFHITERDIIANQAPFDFDVSVKDIYSALKTGATLVIVPRRLFSAPVQLLDFLCDHQVTTLIWAVSALCLVSTFHGLDYKTPTTVNKVLFSGEVMPLKHLRSWREHLPEAMFVNLYGPTEITCNCTYAILPDRDFAPDEVLPIGRAFPNEKVFLLDESDALVTEPGQAGELCVSGTALALGYYADPVRTAQAFTQNPLNPNWYERIYRTGDLARYDENGNLFYIGRKDFQIKHMGHRVELGEIEAAAMRCDDVSRACCIFDAEKQRLHLFYTGSCEKAALLTALKANLPPFMQPNTVQQLDELPTNKNGKIDRTALAALTKKGARK